MIHTIAIVWFIIWLFSSKAPQSRERDYRPKTEKEIAKERAREKDRASDREMRRLESCWAKFERDCQNL